MKEIILPPPYTPDTVVVHTHSEHKKTLRGDMKDMMEHEK